MVERAKEMMVAMVAFDMTLNCIPELRRYALNKDEWLMIDELIKLLSPFREATVMLSNEHSPTLSRVTSVYQLLFDHLESYFDQNEKGAPTAKRRSESHRTHPEWLVNAAENGWQKLQKYYPTSDGLVHIGAIGKMSSAFISGICREFNVRFSIRSAIQVYLV